MTSYTKQTDEAPDDAVGKRLKRVQGQLGGIILMYEDERACVDIVRQVVAARNALGSIARELLTDEASRCFKQRKSDELSVILKELLR